MDIYSTKQLKGIAILFVIIGHLNQAKLIYLPGPLKYIAAWGVSIFLVVSGYGLTKSYMNSGLNNYFNKRLSKILYPYMLITAIWILIDLHIGKTYPLKTILISLIGFNFNTFIDSSMWFITYIILWYICFYFVFKLPIHSLIRLTILFGVSIFCYLAPNWNWNLYLFIFPLGVMLGLYYDVFKKYIPYLSVVAFILFSLLVNKSGSNLKIYILNTMFFVTWFIPIINKIKLILLRFIGSISYEIYLFESVFLIKYKIFFINNVLTIFLYFVVVLALSYILNKLTNFKLINSLTKKVPAT